MRPKRIRWLAVIAAVAMAGTVAVAQAYDGIPVSGGETISGTINLSGIVPPAPPIKVTKHPQECGTEVPYEALIVGADKGIENVATARSHPPSLPVNGRCLSSQTFPQSHNSGPHRFPAGPRGAGPGAVRRPPLEPFAVALSPTRAGPPSRGASFPSARGCSASRRGRRGSPRKAHAPRS